VFLVHPGGPFWKAKDLGAWSIPKGEFEPAEDPLESAKREFAEETRVLISGTFVPLLPVKQPGGKVTISVITAQLAVRSPTRRSSGRGPPVRSERRR
jgi:predicted NUDIX family NTP pyrophosphohydrolase